MGSEEWLKSVWSFDQWNPLEWICAKKQTSERHFVSWRKHLLFCYVIGSCNAHLQPKVGIGIAIYSYSIMYLKSQGRCVVISFFFFFFSFLCIDQMKRMPPWALSLVGYALVYVRALDQIPDRCPVLFQLWLFFLSFPVGWNILNAFKQTHPIISCTFSIIPRKLSQMPLFSKAFSQHMMNSHCLMFCAKNEPCQIVISEFHSHREN